MPKKYIETVGAKGFRDKPIGSGPWKFVRNVPGDRIEYEAVTTPHWRGTPQFKRLTLLLVPEQSTRLAMVRTGEASIVEHRPRGHQGGAGGGMQVVSVPGTMQAVYQFWGLYRPEVKGSPLTDVRVREALSLAIDRQQIIDHVMAKQARWPLPFTTFRYSIERRHAALGGLGEEGAPLRSGPRQAAPRRGRPPQRLQDDLLEHRAARHAVHDPDRRGGRRLLGEDRRQGRDEDGGVGRLRSHGARGDQKGLVGTASMYRTAGARSPSPRYAGHASPPPGPSTCSAIPRTARRPARRPTGPTRRR